MVIFIARKKKRCKKIGKIRCKNDLQSFRLVDGGPIYNGWLIGFMEC